MPWTENPRVGSSTLPPGTIIFFRPLCAGIAQSVERFTRNEEVRGSIPRSSSSKILPPNDLRKRPSGGSSFGHRQCPRAVIGGQAHRPGAVKPLRRRAEAPGFDHGAKAPQGFEGHSAPPSAWGE